MTQRFPPDMLPDAQGDTLPQPTAHIVSLLLRGARRTRAQEAVRAGHLTHVKSDDVLAPQKLPRMATQSLWLLVGSAAFYAVCVGLARIAWRSGPLFGDGPLWRRIALLIAANILGYILVIPAHEAAHALVIVALGGRPRFGLKLPFAAYCTAPNQLFTRNGYLVIALAPLVLLSLVGVVVAAVAPDIAAALLLAFAGNVSGAVGDLEAARGVRELEPEALIADTATGYTAYKPFS